MKTVKAEYKRDLQNNYLVLEIPVDAEESGYRMQMAEQNRIEGLLSFRSARKDGVLQLHYEITSMQPLASMFEKKVMGYRDLVFVLTGIRNTLEEMQKYLLNPAQILFDPQYMFVSADRKRVELCYAPGQENDAAITVLAEFFLKRLNHEDWQAVVIGYEFYQRALEENFSLQRVLREILSTVREQEGQISEKPRETEEYRRRAEPDADDERYDGAAKRGAANRGAEREAVNWGATNRSAEREVSKRGTANRNTEQENVREERSEYGEVRKKGRFAGKLFSMIHPAVLLSGLFLTAILEIIFYLGYLNLTETGGIFFLLTSVEMLINRFWRNREEKRQQEKNRWIDDEEDEEYRILQEEMYAEPVWEEELQETRCLIPSSGGERMRLVCTKCGGREADYPDIIVGREPVCVGKIKGEADILLDSPTVSRMHAKLSCKDGSCFVKDLNSKNGTFCKGERLRPQEERRLAPGDTVAFAEVEYRVEKQC